MRNSKNGARTADPMDLLRDDLSAIKQDLSALVSGRLGQAGENVRAIAEQTMEKAGAAHQRLCDTAAAHPIATIALSAAAGAVAVKIIGWMSRR